MEDKLRKSSGWNRLRRGYGGSGALLEYAVMHDDEAVTSKDHIASKASSIRTKARKLKTDATAALDAAKRKIKKD